MISNEKMDMVSQKLNDLLELDPAALQLALDSGSVAAVTASMYGPDTVAHQKAEFKKAGLTKDQVGIELQNLRDALEDLRGMVTDIYGELGPHNEVLFQLLGPAETMLQEVYDTYENGDCEVMIEVMPDCKLPAFAHDEDGGMDVASRIDEVIEPGEIKKIPIGIKVAIPKGWKLGVHPRSGLSLQGISVANSPGTVDARYFDEICIILRNDTKNAYQIQKGDRIAQIALEKIYRPAWKVVPNLAEAVDVPSRANAEGQQGFGSSGR